MIRMFINLAHDDAFWRGIRYAFLIILFRLAADGIMARASDDVTATMARVEQALVQAGYADAAGYSQLSPPAVEEVDELPGDRWGSYSVATGRITISRGQPEGCKRLTLAHEVAHDIVARMKLHLVIPVNRVIAFMERVSLVAEAAVDAEDYSPNCTMRGGAPL